MAKIMKRRWKENRTRQWRWNGNWQRHLVIYWPLFVARFGFSFLDTVKMTMTMTNRVKISCAISPYHIYIDIHVFFSHCLPKRAAQKTSDFKSVKTHAFNRCAYNICSGTEKSYFFLHALFLLVSFRSLVCLSFVSLVDFSCRTDVFDDSRSDAMSAATIKNRRTK